MKKIKRRTLLTTAVTSLVVVGSYPLTRAQGLGGLVNTTAQTIRDKRPIVHEGGIRFGAYDPHGDFSSQKNVSTEGLFLPWEDVDLDSLKLADTYALERNRNLLITIEPWSWDVGWRLTSDQLRQKVMRGDYDVNMRTISALIGQMKSPVIVRWAQEMEDTSGRFSWAGWAPQDYITAYRRMMDILRQEAPKAERMWSPKGLPNLTAYYPGDGYVDQVGLSVFGLEGYDERAYGAPRNFPESLKQGYDLVEGYGKPVWVAEFGYEGSDGYITPWMQEATLKRDEFPSLVEVVYFNDRDVHAWPFNLGRPDWRVVRGEATN
ncbi:glycosyl hydrolase family 5 [Rhizobium cremeum]|uniref:glycoside hydrolase family 26 protein n=1 Tax=Rhizobium cremeum TaxID=2813827 RepID=UPI000DDAD5A3|nr:glycosyl hydrolase [Rhizobium cremeum]MCJ7997484.1 glycosyl hydrolase family 5 [Rhizobium cremeum]MCJ8002578.1 glycosyl hydrolase family 5 [Rhizobium cremeum]